MGKTKQKTYREYSREYREFMKYQQKLFFGRFLNPTFNGWLEKSLADGLISQEDYEKLKSPTWETIPLDWVDNKHKEKNKNDSSKR